MRFDTIFRTGLSTFLILSLGGCTTTWQSPGVCAAIGAGVGAVGGGVGGGLYAANNDNRNHAKNEAAGIAVASTAVGAGVGYLVCRLMEEEPKPEPSRAATPAPTPPPKPAPTQAPPPEPDPCAGLVRLEGVNFDHDKSDIGPQAAAILDKTATALQRCPEKRVRLDAYTDSAGSDAYNQALSKRRADSVRGYLVQHGVAADRIEARGLGESNPVASNETAEGRAQNRRVEIQPIE